VAASKKAGLDGGSPTPLAILDTAERLFAQYGIAAVSNRRVAEEAGAANNFAVGYHFGTKEDLVLAVMRRHNEPLERWRAENVRELAGSDDPHAYIAALARQLPAYLAQLDPPSYLARFSVQTMTDPAWRQVAMANLATSPAEVALLAGLHAAVRHTDLGLTPEVLDARVDVMSFLVTQVCADHERLGERSRFRSWEEVGDFLVDAACGLMLAPVHSGQSATGRRGGRRPSG